MSTARQDKARTRFERGSDTYMDTGTDSDGHRSGATREQQHDTAATRTRARSEYRHGTDKDTVTARTQCQHGPSTAASRRAARAGWAWSCRAGHAHRSAPMGVAQRPRPVLSCTRRQILSVTMTLRQSYAAEELWSPLRSCGRRRRSVDLFASFGCWHYVA